MKYFFNSKQKLLKHCEAPSKGSKGQCQWGKGKPPDIKPQPGEILGKKLNLEKKEKFLENTNFFY